jgi:hypothetical protein
MHRILELWRDNPSRRLKFSEIQSIFGWNNRKLTHRLKKLVEEGYLKKELKDGQEYYICTKPEYMGYFDVWELMREIDIINKNKGYVNKIDLGFISGLATILLYGCPKLEDLTPIEQDMLEIICKNLRKNFLYFSQLAEAVAIRMELEKENPLPDTVRNSIFDEGAGEVDINAMWCLYGDALWHYIFQYFISLIEFELVQGTLDMTGPSELLAVMPKLLEVLDTERENIFKGKYADGHYSETARRIESAMDDRFLEKMFDSTVEGNATGIMITVSPRVLDRYSDQVGKIISDQIQGWGENDILKVVEKGQDRWHDLLKTSHGNYTRRELLKYSIIDMILLMRRSYDPILYERDKKFMRDDENLREIFSREEINEIIEKIQELSDRIKFFVDQLKKGVSFSEVKNHGKWFTEEEKFLYREVERLISQWRDGL